MFFDVAIELGGLDEAARGLVKRQQHRAYSFPGGGGSGSSMRLRSRADCMAAWRAAVYFAVRR